MYRHSLGFLFGERSSGELKMNVSVENLASEFYLDRNIVLHE